MAKRGSKLNAKAKKSGLSITKKNNIRKAKANKQGKLTTGQKKVKKEAKEKKKKKTFAELKEKSVRSKIHQEREAKNITKNIPSGKNMMAMMDPDDLKYLIAHETAREVEENKKKNESKQQQQQQKKIREQEQAQAKIDKLASKGEIPKIMEKKLRRKERRKQIQKQKNRKLDLNDDGDDDDDDVEESYEQKLTDLPDGPKMRKLLPIKTSKGIVSREIPKKEEMDDADSGVLDDIESSVPATVTMDYQPKEEKKNS